MATAAATFEVMAAAAAATTKVKWIPATAGKIKISAVVAELITKATAVKTTTVTLRIPEVKKKVPWRKRWWR